MKKSFLILVALLSALFASAQDCKYYDVLMQKANQLWAEGKFEQALNQLTAAREHCPSKTATVDAQFVAFTKKIAQKYREAEAEKLRAEQETQNAKNATSRADRSALINRLGALALQKSKTNDYTLAWHLAVQAYQYAYDSLEGRSIEPGVSSIMYDIISDTTNWLYKPIGRPNDEIRSAVFSPDAQSIITYAENSIDLWDKNGQLLKTLETGDGLGKPIFSPDGEYLLTFANNTAHVWDKSIALIQSVEVNEPVRKVVFSPDGQSIFIMGTQAVYLWDKSGSPIQALEKSAGIEHFTFSPNGHMLTWREDDNQLQLRDKIGKILLTLETAEFIQGATFLPGCPENPNGRQYILAKNGGYGNESVIIWDEKGQQIKTLSNQRDSEKTASSPDGQLIQDFGTGHGINSVSLFLSMCSNNPKTEQYILTYSGNHVYWWHQDGRLMEVKVVDWAYNLIKSPSFSRDGALIAVHNGWLSNRGFEPFVILFKNGYFFKNLDQVIEVVFSPDDQHILTVLENSFGYSFINFSANMLDKNWQRLNTFKPVKEAVFSPACPENPQGGQYLLTTADGKARLWRKNAQALQTLQGNERITSAVFSADGQHILTQGNGQAQLWDSSGKLIKTFENLKNEFHSPAAKISLDGQRILTQGNGQAQLWDSSGQLIKTFENLKDEFYRPAAKISLDGQRILTQGDRLAQLWDAQGQLIKTLQSSTGKQIAEFSPDGQRILTYADSTVLLWTKNGQLIKRLETGSSGIHTITFSPDGQSILGSGYEGTDRLLWNIQGQLIDKIQLNAIDAVEFAPDGRFFYSLYGGAGEQGIEVFDRTGRKINIFEGYTQNMLSLVFSPDDQFILTSQDNTAQLWDKTGKVLKTVLEGHTNAVRGAIFSPACPADPKGGQFILTWSNDQTTRLWDKSGQPLRIIYGPVTNAQFSPDGQFILILDQNEESMHLWEGLPQYIRSHTQLGAADLLQAGAILDNKLLLEQSTPAELAKIGEIYFQQKDWSNARLFYATSNQRQPSPEALIGLFKVARKMGQVFDNKRFLVAENAAELRKYGNYFFTTAYQERVVPIPVAYNQWNTNPNAIRREYDQSPLDPNDPSRTLLQFATQLYEKSEKLKHSAEALIRLHLIAEMTEQPFDFQRFLATDDVEELRQYADYLMSFNASPYKTKIPYAQLAVRLGEKMLVLDSGTRQKMALARYYNWLGFCQLFIPDGAAAETSLRRALALDSTLVNLPIHLAHALLLQGRYLDAEKFYLEYQSKLFKYRDYKTNLLGDFKTLEAQGVNHPDIVRIRMLIEGQNIEKLNLGSKKLKAIPPEVFQYKQLKELQLNDNNLESLPNEISTLKNLQFLNLDSNQLTILPAEIGQLQQLQILGLNSNQLMSLPAEIGQLKQLRFLDLSDNPLPESEIESFRRRMPWCKIEFRLPPTADDWLRAKRYKEAFLTAQEAIARDSTDAKMKYPLSYYALYAGEYQKAIEYAREALQSDPEDETAERYLAPAYLLNGQYGQAEVIYKKWKGKEFAEANEDTADATFLQDIADLEAAGITHPDFAKVKKLFGE